MAQLVPCLVGLRAEFNELYPDRPKGADGWIGDPAHAARSSDHNPDSRGLVHALDITTIDDLEKLVQFVLARCRSGAEKRLKYVIFNRRIWQAKNGWREETYTGSNDPHTGHAHFSALSTPARENDTAPWHLEDVPMALTSADKVWIAAEIREAVRELASGSPLLGADRKPDGTSTTPIGVAALSQGVPNPFTGGKRTAAYVLLGDIAEAVKAQTSTASGK